MTRAPCDVTRALAGVSGTVLAGHTGFGNAATSDALTSAALAVPPVKTKAEADAAATRPSDSNPRLRVFIMPSFDSRRDAHTCEARIATSTTVSLRALYACAGTAKSIDHTT